MGNIDEMPDPRSTDYLRRFENLTFADFRRMALDETLSPCEKVGFPDAYRKGKERKILADVVAKVPLLSGRAKQIIEIGPGCSELPRLMIDLCREQDHTVYLVDSSEMLSQLPDDRATRKIPGYFPACMDRLAELQGRVDVIIAYSVVHYVFAESNLWDFLDACLSLLAPGGQLLLGDVPNVSKRKRFFASAAGVRHHQAFTGTDEVPTVQFNTI